MKDVVNAMDNILVGTDAKEHLFVVMYAGVNAMDLKNVDSVNIYVR